MYVSSVPTCTQRLPSRLLPSPRPLNSGNAVCRNRIILLMSRTMRFAWSSRTAIAHLRCYLSSRSILQRSEHFSRTEMKMISPLCCSLLLVAAIFAQRPSQEASALIGTWRVVEFADLDKDGNWQYWFGDHPRGYFVYDATGHVHIQIMRVP